MAAAGRALRERLGAVEVQRGKGPGERLVERDGAGGHGEGRGTDCPGTGAPGKLVLVTLDLKAPKQGLRRCTWKETGCKEDPETE